MNKGVLRTVIRAALAVSLALAACTVYALGGGTSSADFLKIGVGARPSAMAGAYAAVADDSNAAYWNPAGIAYTETWDITFMHLVWYANTGYDFLSAVMPIDTTSGIGLSVNYFWVPEFNSTQDSLGVFLEPSAAASYDLALTLTYARIVGNIYTNDFTIGNIALGANITYVQRKLLDTMMPGMVMADVGLTANLTDNIRGAIVLQDIGADSGDDQTPFAARIGAAWDIGLSKDIGLLLACDVSKPIDSTNPDYSKLFVSLGFEAKLFGYGYLRGGYRSGDSDSGLTAGAGFGLPDIGSVDYAFAPHNELGSSHRISLSFKFGAKSSRPVVGAPQPPQKINAVSGDKIVSIGWDPNPESNITGYNIYYREKGAKEYDKLNTKPIMEESRFKAVLKNDVTYDFVVTAINNRNLESVHSEAVMATPKKYEPKKPAVVTNVSAKVEGSSITVEWNDSREDFVAGYNLYYKKEGDARSRKLNKGLLRESKATLAGLKAGIQYIFTATAVSKDGLESDSSSEAKAKISAAEDYF